MNQNPNNNSQDNPNRQDEQDKQSIQDQLAFDRTMMALMRTFLAFCRTALGLLASGAGLVILQNDKTLIGLGFFLIVFAAAVLLYGVWFCRKTKKSLLSAL